MGPPSPWPNESVPSVPPFAQEEVMSVRTAAADANRPTENSVVESIDDASKYAWGGAEPLRTTPARVNYPQSAVRPAWGLE
jgi:hypothetical protein